MEFEFGILRDLAWLDEHVIAIAVGVGSVAPENHLMEPPAEKIKGEFKVTGFPIVDRANIPFISLESGDSETFANLCMQDPRVIPGDWNGPEERQALGISAVVGGSVGKHLKRA